MARIHQRRTKTRTISFKRKPRKNKRCPVCGKFR